MSKTHGSEYETFGKRVSELRERKRLSQIQMGEILDIPQSTYAGYETGKRKVPLSIIRRVSEYFDVSIDYLLAEELETFKTVAAHHDHEDWTAEELEYIDIVKNMLIEKRKRR